jgi:hypothetical protein
MGALTSSDFDKVFKELSDAGLCSIDQRNDAIAQWEMNGRPQQIEAFIREHLSLTETQRFAKLDRYLRSKADEYSDDQLIRWWRTLGANFAKHEPERFQKMFAQQRSRWLQAPFMAPTVDNWNELGDQLLQQDRRDVAAYVLIFHSLLDVLDMRAGRLS